MSTLTLIPGEGTSGTKRQDYSLEKVELRQDPGVGSTVATMFQAWSISGASA